jgi:hypothetical protein
LIPFDHRGGSGTGSINIVETTARKGASYRFVNHTGSGIFTHFPGVSKGEHLGWSHLT